MLNDLARGMRSYPLIALALLVYASYLLSQALPRLTTLPWRLSPPSLRSSGWLGIPAMFCLGLSLGLLLTFVPPFTNHGSQTHLAGSWQPISVFEAGVLGYPALGGDGVPPALAAIAPEGEESAGAPPEAAQPDPLVAVTDAAAGSDEALVPAEPSAADVAPDDAAAPAAAAADETPAPRTATSYVVRAGDTLNSIARRFDLAAATIVAANGLSEPDRVLLGQRLFIPASDDAVPSPSPAAAIPRGPGQSTAFIAALVPAAQESQRITGVPTSVTLAQAILETYWGTSYLAREANNYFGLKAYASPGTAGVVWLDVWEVEDGADVTRGEPFRKYEQPMDSLVDHGRFFLENSRYAYALQARDDPREFARRINTAGYATDPAYAGKLIGYMDRFNLYQYDVTPGN